MPSYNPASFFGVVILSFKAEIGFSVRFHGNTCQSFSQTSLEAVLVNFGRSYLIFLFERSWKSMKNDATFVHMRNGDLLGDAKMSKKRRLAPSYLTFFTTCRRQKQFSQNERRRADLQS